MKIVLPLIKPVLISLTVITFRWAWNDYMWPLILTTTDKMLEYSEYLNQISTLPLDVHLMVNDVPGYISSFSIFEPNIITFHLLQT